MFNVALMFYLTSVIKFRKFSVSMLVLILNHAASNVGTTGKKRTEKYLKETVMA
jgi:hypothetical protein